jgi:hypothetical protein
MTGSSDAIIQNVQNVTFHVITISIPSDTYAYLIRYVLDLKKLNPIEWQGIILAR